MMMNLLSAALAAAAAQPQFVEMRIPTGTLAGTYVAGTKRGPVVVIVPGSGMTDRDGNNPSMIKAAPYRFLADDLQKRGIGSLRFDKRGLFGSKGALTDPNQVSIRDYADDVRRWALKARTLAGTKCAWVAGHSEGALVALAAAQQKAGICGVITVAGPGRPIGAVLREQLKSNPANGPVLQAAMEALDTLEHGGTVNESSLPAPLRPLFRSAIQPYLRDLLSYDPAQLARQLSLPLLIVQGDRDLQVSVDDARVLAGAQPRASLVILAGTNHVLKEVESADRAANFATYGDPDRPLAKDLVPQIAAFIKAHSK